MAKKSYFNNGDVPPSCSYCFHGTISKTGTHIMCSKMGVLTIGFTPCKKYTYDPFARIPASQLEKQEKYADAIKANEEMRRERARQLGIKLDEED